MLDTLNFATTPKAFLAPRDLLVANEKLRSQNHTQKRQSWYSPKTRKQQQRAKRSFEGKRLGTIRGERLKQKREQAVREREGKGRRESEGKKEG